MPERRGEGAITAMLTAAKAAPSLLLRVLLRLLQAVWLLAMGIGSDGPELRRLSGVH